MTVSSHFNFKGTFRNVNLGNGLLCNPDFVLGRYVYNKNGCLENRSCCVGLLKLVCIIPIQQHIYRFSSVFNILFDCDCSIEH